MKPHLANILNWDNPDAQDGWQPEGAESFRIDMTAYIGSDGDPEGDDGVDAFDFVVCSPGELASVYDDQLSQQTKQSGAAPLVLPLRGVLVQERFDLAAIEAKVSELCDQTWGDTWESVGAQLNAWLDWEFSYRLNPRWRDHLSDPS